MARLTEEEQSLLKKLTAKAEAPDEPPMGKNVSFSLDLGDEAQIKRAIRFGLLPDLGDSEGEGKEGESGEGGEGDETPKRRGYFKE